jgi:hypothetical protein
MGYESFIMDLGMYENVFYLDYNCFSVLATNGTWFKNIWELLYEFNTVASFGTDVQIHPVREGNRSLMQEFSQFYSGCDLHALNIYWQYKKAINLSCVVLCAGHTISKEYLSPREGSSELHKFPLQRPSCSDHALWVTALKRISLEYYSLPFTLGGFVKCLHKAYKWTTSYDGTRVHFEMVLDGVQQYIVYTLTSEPNTQSGRRFIRRVILLPFPSHFMPASHGYQTTRSNSIYGLKSIKYPMNVGVCSGRRSSKATTQVCGGTYAAMMMESGYGKDYAVGPSQSYTMVHTCGKYLLIFVLLR